MTRLPNPGGDTGAWGNLLNDFLSVEHNADGTLKASALAKARMLNWQNVQDFGAKGDGTTDDTAAIASALATRGVIYFPAGIYIISSELNINGVRAIIGDNPENDDDEAVSVIKQTSTTANGLHGQNIANFSMRNIRLDGPGSGSGKGFYLDGPAVSWYVHLEDVRVQNWGSDGVNAFAVVSTFENVLSMNNGRHGFTFDGLNGGAAATSIAIIGCFARSNQAAGYHMYNMTYCSFSGCAADFNGVGYAFDTCAAISVQGCGCESPVNRSGSYPGLGYRMVSCTGVTLTATFLTGNLSTGWLTSASDNVVLINPAEILPTGSATASITVSSGSVEIIGPAIVTAMSLAAGTTTVIGMADKSSSIAGALSVGGNLSVSGVGRRIYAPNAADQSVTSSTTLVNATGLSASVAAGSTYVVEIQGIFTADTVGGIKLGWATLPAGASLAWTIPASTGAGTGSVFDGTASDTWAGSGATQRSFWYRGTLVTAGTAGTLQFQFAQAASNGTATILKAGSWLKLERVA